MAPGLFEPLKVRFESHPRIVSIDVVLRELLDDHEYEQIEHNVRDDEDEGQEEERRNIRAASFAFDAVWGRIHTIVHDPIPILSSRYREQKLEAQVEISEVLPFVNDITFGDFVEERVSKDSHDEEDEH